MSLPDKSAYQNIGAAWILARNGEVPPNAVIGGYEVNEEVLYVSRFYTKEGQLAPGKLNPHHRAAHNGCCWKEQIAEVYQVLTHPDQSQLKWVPSSGNNVPTGALQGGKSDGGPLFIARAKLEGGVCCGKFEPAHGCVYLAWGGREHQVTDNFEVLCIADIS